MNTHPSALVTLTHQGTLYRLVTQAPTKSHAVKMGTKMEREGWSIVVRQESPSQFGVYAGLKKNPPLMVIGNPRTKKNSSKKSFMYQGFYIVYIPRTKTYQVTEYGKYLGFAINREHAKGIVDGILMSRPSKNPPDGDLMSDSVHEIRYTHRKDGAPYKHSFKAGVRMVANEDGTITMYHPTKRIHEEFPE